MYPLRFYVEMAYAAEKTSNGLHACAAVRKSGGSMTLDNLISVVKCPACALSGSGALEPVGTSWLVCRDCDRKYPVVDGVAVMLLQEGDRWRSVTRDKLPPAA